MIGKKENMFSVKLFNVVSNNNIKYGDDHRIYDILLHSTIFILFFCWTIIGCRETAFVYALTSAAVAHSIARACSEGILYLFIYFFFLKSDFF